MLQQVHAYKQKDITLLGLQEPIVHLVTSLISERKNVMFFDRRFRRIHPRRADDDDDNDGTIRDQVGRSQDESCHHCG